MNSPITAQGARFIKREIDWRKVIAFHADIARRMEASFFEIALGPSRSERWSHLERFVPPDASGAWALSVGSFDRENVKKWLSAPGGTELFVGGPCWVAFRKEENLWKQYWRPMLYRLIRLDPMDDGGYRIVPERGEWDVSPILTGILDSKEQAATERPLAEMVPGWLEKAFRPAQNDRRNATQRLREAILDEVPELRKHLSKAVRHDPDSPFAQQPTQWILFSAPQSSGMTRHLVGDYKKLDELLTPFGAEVGGLRLFEGYRDVTDPSVRSPSPIISLNESQEAAVQDILAARPITVISGPPGCGKSQVVLSLLLNAWERGLSVLFSSNNNQAVDVVRDRLAVFEDDFPVIVRSGSRERSTLLSTLMNTMNYVSGRSAETPAQVKATEDRLQALIKQANELKAFLASHLPDQVNQTLRSALGAYGTYQETMAEHTRQKVEVQEAFQALRIECIPERFEVDVVRPVEEWLARLQHYEGLLSRDQQSRIHTENELQRVSADREQALRDAGLPPGILPPEQLLVNESAPEALGTWLVRYQQLFAQSLDRQLEPFPWRESYDRWSDEPTAATWAETVRGVVVSIRTSCVDVEDAYVRIEGVRVRYEQQRDAMQKRGMDPTLTVADTVIAEWSGGFAAETTIPPGRLDWLPWTDRSRARRAMRRAERVLRPAISLSAWQSIGPLNVSGRNRLAEVVLQIRDWLSVRAEWDALSGERHRLDQIAAALRRSVAQAAQRNDAPRSTDPEAWRRFAMEIEQEAILAEEAAKALARRAMANMARAAIGDLLTSFRSSSAASPVRDAWLAGPAADFGASLDLLERNASATAVRNARSVLASTPVARFVELWVLARNLQRRAVALTHQLDGIPPARTRCAEWRAEMPPRLAGLVELPFEILPSPDHAVFALLVRIRGWHQRWLQFAQTVSPGLTRKEHTEKEWARAKLQEVVGLLLDGDAKMAASRLVDQVLQSSVAWPTLELQRAFEEFNPDRIRGALDGLRVQIQSTAFSVAKAAWLSRIVADRKVLDALDDLHTHYTRNHERLQPTAYELFKSAQTALPLWVSTAMASQSIPMKAGVFDILVIDEATQCTLTNVLPLIFRAKRLVVIGDPDQLPAIPAIGRGSEASLSTRYGLTDDTLQLLAHNNNDLYRSAARCMPGGRSRVRLLNEHYRSHPLIIGFSNQHVYQKKLRLRTTPFSKDQLPFGGAVHGRKVAGACEKGQNGSSWINDKESTEVRHLLEAISANPTLKAMSIGVVTPFRAQEELIKAKLQGLELAADVQVGTAHAFQGDERDIMIFSPVVSAGITPGAARWVEEPRNLINVAVTRARQGLFVVADFEVCRVQPGILGHLIKYVETVETLRQTSPEELDLFSWMTVQGWSPQVHKRGNGVEVDFILTNQGRSLAIEVDGKQHEKTTAEDSARDAMLVGKGYEVLRVPAREVREMPSRVIQTIAERLGLPLE